MKAKGFTRETILGMGVEDRKFPAFKPGDTIGVSVKIKEGNKERLQLFQGDVIGMKDNGISSTFTVRKIGAHSIPVERIFPFHSPIIDSIKIVRTGKVRRAKLNYVRDRVGKAAKFKEVRLSKKELEKQAQAAAPVQEPAPAPEKKEAPKKVEKATEDKE